MPNTGGRVTSAPRTACNFDDASYKLIASLAIRLIGLLLVFASQKIVHNVRDEMAEFVVPLRKEIKDSLTRQGMQNLELQ